MKKILSIMLVLLLGLSSIAASAEAFDAKGFSTWFEEEGVWRTVTNDTSAQEGGAKGGFITEASAAPTQEDLKAMLHMASLGVTSSGKSDWYMVAVTDPDEQRAIIGDKYGISASEGTATVLVFGERLIREELRTDENNKFQPDRGYYDAGIITGYLNIAAISKGYATHMFMSPALEGTNDFNDGGLGLDCAKYLDGTTYYMASKHESYSTENMKFVCAIVIGTLDETVETGLTTKEFPDNWSIWEKK
ncbi:MAG: hypothetical protein RR893_00460 [Clostridia bacterium]